MVLSRRNRAKRAANQLRIPKLAAVRILDAAAVACVYACSSGPRTAPPRAAPAAIEPRPIAPSALNALLPNAGQSVDWPGTGGAPENDRYSPLDQINRTNVRPLQVAWIDHTGSSANCLTSAGKKTE